MKERSFDEMVAYFNRRVSEMDIAQDYKMELLDMVTALGYKHEKTAQQWIPCSERLPEENVWTICQNNAGAMMIGKYDIEFGWMFPAYFDGIVAWMPLPEPYTKRRGK